eukprot:8861811-Alexandrium_andersonii.AAC.1
MAGREERRARVRRGDVSILRPPPRAVGCQHNMHLPMLPPTPGVQLPRAVAEPRGQVISRPELHRSQCCH